MLFLRFHGFLEMGEQAALYIGTNLLPVTGRHQMAPVAHLFWCSAQGAPWTGSQQGKAGDERLNVP